MFVMHQFENGRGAPAQLAKFNGRLRRQNDRSRVIYCRWLMGGKRRPNHGPVAAPTAADGAIAKPAKDNGYAES
jgi:hypothetical protein